MSPTRRYFIWEVARDSGEESRAGRQDGYPDSRLAIATASRLAQRTGLTHGIGLFEVQGDDRDCLEVIGYEHPDDDES